jgi:hypothetical protein
MIFGIPVQPLWVIAGGVTLFVLTVFQVLVGMRKIKLGRKTMVYHRWIAWVILGGAVVHGTLGALFAMGWNLF